MFATTVTAEMLAAHLGRTKDTDAVEVARIYGEAVELLTDAFAVTFRTPPAEVMDDCLYRVGRALWDSRKPLNVNAQLTQVAGETGVRPARDPLAPVAHILGRYVVPL